MTRRVYTVPEGVRAAASLLLLRDGEPGMQVLMMVRPEREGDNRGGAAVFPGGVLEASDREAFEHVHGADDAALSAPFGLDAGMLDYAVAALRETFEEVGLLLACGADGSVARPHPAWAMWRSRLHRAEATIAAMCAHERLRLDMRNLACYGHWLTPPGPGKRFDTRFFLTLAPAGQEPEADRGEAVALMWLTPAQALDPERQLKLLPVTRNTLQNLSRFARAADAHGEARERRDIRRMMPRRVQSNTGRRVVLPGDLAYAEVGHLDPQGRGDVLAEIVPGRAVRLSSRIVRVTAPNASVMTGPGTNSYFVGDPEARRWALIDPGPADAAHLQALQAAAPGPVQLVLVTHTHVDHSPGAAAAAAAFGAQVLGRRAAVEQGQDTSLRPSREPEHGERIEVGPGTTLRVLHTPGHASNHLCYLLEQEKLLFTGDHVMNGSTVVINPPDGDMAAYLRALHALLDEELEWFAPGHGWLVAEPHAVLRALIAHRLRREAKVVDALRPRGTAAIDEMLPEVYADTPQSLWPMARRSLLAHLLKLREDARVASEGERWRWLE